MIVPPWVPIGLILAALGLTLIPDRKNAKSDDDDCDIGRNDSGDKSGSAADGHHRQGSVDETGKGSNDSSGGSGNNRAGESHAAESVHSPKSVGAENHADDQTDHSNDSGDDGGNVGAESDSGQKPDSTSND